MASTRQPLFLLMLCFLVASAMQSQPVRSSYLGLRLDEIDNDQAKSLGLSLEAAGVEVADVRHGAAADQAGIKIGDVLLTYNGEKILGVQQFVRLVGETPQGRQVRIALWRGGAQKEIVVTTGAPPLPPPDAAGDARHMPITDIPAPIMIWRNVVLGIESEEMSEQLAQAFAVKHGVLVWMVAPAYPAQRAGLRAGDILTGFCGHPIRSPRDLGLILEMQQGQKSVSVELVRDRKPMSILVTLEAAR